MARVKVSPWGGFFLEVLYLFAAIFFTASCVKGISGMIAPCLSFWLLFIVNIGQIFRFIDYIQDKLKSKR